MNMLKRSLSMILVLCMLLSTVPFAAFASESAGVPSESAETAADVPEGENGQAEDSEAETPIVNDPVEDTPSEDTPSQDTPSEDTPSEDTPSEDTPSEDTPSEDTPSEDTPSQDTPAGDTPSEDTSDDDMPADDETTGEATDPTEADVEAILEEDIPQALTEDVYTGTVSRPAEFLKVFHLDVGRKYFTVDEVKAVIDLISEKGYSHLELAIGNDGLRLLLDDMSVSANDTTYSGSTITSAIKAANQSYSHAGEFSQSEMDTIISYARSKGIQIIPLVNNPGHMDAIVAAMEAVGIDGAYNGSARTVDVTNEKAVAFTQALVSKYMDYFADRGSKYFNMGADEYANDIYTSDSTGMGFGHLIDNNKYNYFIDYVNAMVRIIVGKGMTPIAFNDGIYFRSNESFGAFDTRLVIAYWSAGWGGIKPATSTFLANKNHLILNTNERWYYVMGRTKSSNSTYCYETALSNAQSVDVTTVVDNTGVSPIGSMQCVWCDDPSVNYDSYKDEVVAIIEAMAENNPTYFTGPSTPETVTKTDEATKVAVSAAGLTGLTVAEAAAPAIEGAVAGKVQAWDITPVTDEGNYAGEAEVSLPVPSDWAKVLGGVMASENGEAVLGIPGKLENGYFTFTVPHFSTVVAYASEYDELIELEVGGTHNIVFEGSDLSGETYTPDPAGVADVTVSYEKVEGETVVTLGSQITPTNSNGWSDTGVIKSGDYYLVMDSDGDLSATTDVAEATVFTVTRSSSNRWTIRSGSRYLRYSSSTLSGSTSSYEWRYSRGFCRSNGDNYLTCSNGNWSASADSGNSNALLYDISTSTTEPVDESTVTFTGVAAGETYVTVGDALYKIVVSRKAVSATITVGDSRAYTDNSASAVSADPTVATASVNNGTLTITAKAIGNTTITTDSAVYTIQVVEFDPSSVAPLTVEYWITNLHTRTIESTTDEPVTEQSITADVSGVTTADGADLDVLLPDWTIKRDGDSGDDREVEFWHVRMLDKTEENNSTSGTQEQTTDSADDETTSGDAVTRVRYYDPGDGNGRRWQLLSGSNWLDVDLEDNQIVAYYMEVVDITNPTTGQTEVHVNAADWGKLGDNSPASSYADTNKYCSISLQIVYEDGTTTNPASTSAEDLDSNTIIFNYWDNGRGIGTFAFDTMGQFKIYQVTAETGEVDVTFTGGAWGTAQVESFEWDDNEKVVWSGESETASLYNNPNYPTDEDPKDNLMWDENHEAILIRIYVKAVETPESLRVHYMDRSANDLEFYNYSITTVEGEVFKEGFDMTGNGLELVNNNVTNYYDGQQRYVSADLKTMPEIKAYYRYCNYTLVDVERSADGKDVYLYYTFTPVVAFVADFGLPIHITPTDLNQDGYTTDASDITAVQVIGSKDTAAGSTAHAEYGTVSVNGTTVTYTPTEILQDIDFFSVYVETTADNPNTTTNESAGINYRVYIFPATTVFYEESFLTYDSSWTGAGSAISVGAQTTEKLSDAQNYNKKNSFGYDAAYAGDASGSNGTNASTNVIGATASFTFTGTGFELYANSNAASGYVSVYSQGSLNKLYMINTELNAGTTDATSQQIGGTYYGLPVISEKELPYGTYTVTIKKTNDTDAIYIDGVRVINTLENSDVFLYDEEDDPSFYQLRDHVLNAIGVEQVTDSEYGTPSAMAGQVYHAANGAAAIILDESISYGSGNAQDLLDNGPKNELYLYKGQTLTFKVNTNRVMQLGLKAPKGSASFELSVNGEKKSLSSLSTSVDMFYKIADKAAAAQDYLVSVTNTGDSVLSVTDLKICDDPNAAIAALSQDDIESVLAGIYDLGGSGETETPEQPETPVVPEEPEVPEEPVVTYADAVLTVTLRDYSGRKLGTAALTVNGVEGDTNVFSAEEILAEAKAVMPGNYAFVDEAKITDVEVVYGEDQTVSIQVGKVATLKITYVSLFGRKVGTATITKVQTANGYCTISASGIRAQAPAGRIAAWLLPAVVPYGNTVSIVVPVI